MATALQSLICVSRNSLRSIGASSGQRRFARGSFWCLTEAALTQGFKMLAFAAVARVLGKDGFGELGLIQNTIGTFGIFAGVGLGVTATRHVSQFRRESPDRAARIITLCTLLGLGSGLLFAVLLLAAAPLLAASVLNSPGLAAQLRIASGLLLFNTLLGVQSGVLAGLEAFRAMAGISVTNVVVSLPLVVLGAIYSGLTGAVVGLVLSALAAAIVSRVVLVRVCRRAGVPVWKRPIAADTAVLFGFSLPALLSSSMNVPVSWVAMTILVNQPHGYSEMGLFSAANQWRMLIAFVPGVLERSSLPILSGFHGAGDHGRFRQVLMTHIFTAFGCAICLALPISMAAPVLMSCYGESFREGWRLIPPLAGAAVLAAGNSAFGTALVSRNQVWLSLLLNGIWGVSLVLFSLRLVPLSGAQGLATAFLLAYIVHTILQGFFWRRLRTRLREADQEDSKP